MSHPQKLHNASEHIRRSCPCPRVQTEARPYLAKVRIVEQHARVEKIRFSNVVVFAAAQQEHPDILGAQKLKRNDTVPSLGWQTDPDTSK